MCYQDEIGQMKCLAPEERLSDPEVGPDVQWTLKHYDTGFSRGHESIPTDDHQLVYHRQTRTER